jgi:hypothetical protein
MERWQFIQSPAGSWYWLCSDVISRKTRTSAATFKTRNECVADAMGYGYRNVVALGTQPQPPNRAPQPKGGRQPRHASRNKQSRRQQS